MKDEIPSTQILLPVIDAHIHLAGLGHGGTGCSVSSRKFNSVMFRMMRWMLGIYNAHKTGRLDQEYLEILDREVSSAVANGALDAVVIYAHDHIYSENGEVQTSELYVPNDYVFACAERESMRGRYLPAMSVHPYRRDALDETERCIERGAVAMKWLPNSQGMDPCDRRCTAIFELLAARKMPLIVHTGGEHTVTVIRPELGNPEMLRPALDLGVTVIMAHSGTRSGIFDDHWIDEFCALARKYPNCWGDTAAFCTPGRTRWIPKLLREQDVVEKLIHGSDYPVPVTAWFALKELGCVKVRELNRIPGILERDIRIKRALGLPDAVFTNVSRVLGAEKLRRWFVCGENLCQ
jgi:predicted TIM-barrel fold metal-dependent hydrolase